MLATAKEKPAIKIPKSNGALADRLFVIRQERLDAQRKVDALSAEETALKDAVIDRLPTSDLTGASGKVGRVTVIQDEVPQVEDWDAFYKYMMKKKAFEMLQRRLSTKAVEERLSAGEKVPGVKMFKFKKVSITKA